MMDCDEFEVLGPDFTGNRARGTEAKEHLRHCPRCAALHESWQDLREGLRTLARQTASAEAPPRVETRLREAVRARKPQPHRIGLLPVWALGVATAAAITFFVVRSARHVLKPVETPSPVRAEPHVNPPLPTVASRPHPQAPATGGTTQDATNAAAHVQARNSRSRGGESARAGQDNTDEFLALPYSTLVPGFDDSAVVRVRMQRASLSALGLPMNEERAGEWVMVDLLVGADGQPQAVRLPR